MIFVVTVGMAASTNYALVTTDRQLNLVGVTGTGKFILSTNKNLTYATFSTSAGGLFDSDVLFHNGAAAITSPIPATPISAGSTLFVANGTAAGQICVYLDDLS